MPASGASTNSTPESRRRGFRPDVDGLRAVAILAVVLYHAHVGVISGGYVGVDVFFVLSGFLITGLLWGEVVRRGRISLSSFYGRRARRLLPASMLVVLATVVASARWLAPLAARGVTKDGVASALYVANFRFALQQTSYLTSTAAPSPLQHYWSLAVEEQFYLLWPLLVFGVSLAWRRSRKVSLPAAVTGLVALGLGSFMLSRWLTDVSQPWAFFSLPTRAWELVAGGLVALAAPRLGRLPDKVAAVVGWAGLAAIAWACLHFTASTAFPGRAALVPVGGTVAVLLAGYGNPRGGPIILLGRRSMQVIGKLSYSWYLWHWPVLVIAPAVVGHPLALWQNLALAALSGGLALATVIWVELPARLSPWLVARPRRSLTAGATATMVGAIACLVVAGSLPPLQGHGVAPVASRSVTTTPTMNVAPADIRLSAATAPIVAALGRSVGTRAVPSNLDPSLGRAHHDEAAPFVDGCLDGFTDASVRRCTFGAAQPNDTVVLFGDSHATQWFPAVDQVANEQGWRLLTLTKATCPPLALPIWSPELGRPFRECDQWRNAVLARIASVRPSLVLIGIARHYGSVYNFQVYSPQWLNALAGVVTDVRQLGARVVVLGPIPKPNGDVPNCLSAHLDTATACTEPTSAGIDASGVAAERSAVQAAGGAYIDTAPWFCTGSTCPVIVDNLLVYRDDNHMTTSYATWLEGVVAAELAATAKH